MGRLIYITGALASGKSTTTRMMLDSMSGVTVWEYGARLTEYLRARGVDLTDQDDLREKSSRLAVAEAINELDDRLLAFAAERRTSGHVLNDSHPVTREHHGFRITAFSHERFRMLAPDEIWCFYTAPEVAVARIKADSRGRPVIDTETARHAYHAAGVRSRDLRHCRGVPSLSVRHRPRPAATCRRAARETGAMTRSTCAKERSA